MKYVPVQNSVSWLKERQQGQPYHNLSEPCGRFMGNRHVGTSLDGLHSRDDELLMVSCTCLLRFYSVASELSQW